LGKPLVEVAGVAPTTVVEVEEESSVEVLASVEKMMGDQAKGTGSEPVLETAKTKLGGEAVGIGEPVHEEDRSGEELDLLEVDQVVRIGDEPVHEAVEEETGTEPVPEDVAMETGDLPVREVGEVIFTLRISLVMTLRRWGSTHLKNPHNHPQTLLLNTLLKKHPPVLNRGGRGPKLRLGGRIFHGSESS